MHRHSVKLGTFIRIWGKWNDKVCALLGRINVIDSCYDEALAIDVNLSDSDIVLIQPMLHWINAKFCHFLIFLEQSLLHVLLTELEYCGKMLWLIAITLHNNQFISCCLNVNNWRIILDAELVPDL